MSFDSYEFTESLRTLLFTGLGYEPTSEGSVRTTKHSVDHHFLYYLINSFHRCFIESDFGSERKFSSSCPRN